VGPSFIGTRLFIRQMYLKLWMCLHACRKLKVFGTRRCGDKKVKTFRPKMNEDACVKPWQYYWQVFPKRRAEGREDSSGTDLIIGEIVKVVPSQSPRSPLPVPLLLALDRRWRGGRRGVA
jgi:hypothetical protein